MPQSFHTVLLVFSALFGATVGSFLNVCIFRLPRHCMSVVRPRSRCPKCLRMIAWYDNLPVLSWLLLGGRCRGCGLPISPRYALVELLTAGLFFVAAWRQVHAPGPGWERAVAFAAQAWFLSVLIVCTFIDLDFRILPDELTLSGIVVGLAVSTAFPFVHVGSPLPFGGEGALARLLGGPEGSGLPASLAGLLRAALGALVGGGALYLVGYLGKWAFRKRIEKLGETEAMGLGDVKYMAMIGTLLGWRGVLLTFVVACVLGSVFGILKLVVLRRMGYAPFGPFLSLGALALLFWSRHVDRAIQAYMDLIRGLGRPGI
jgi:leader peptidase (prepilin peptidase)/N-methyltransferase